MNGALGRVASPRTGAAALLVLAVASAGCQRARAALPAPPSTVDVRLREFAVEPRPSNVRPGRVVLQITNAGTAVHRLVVAALPPDFPPILEHLRGPTRRFVEPLAAVPNIAPGETRSVALDLVPGRYALLCPLSSPAGEAYAAKGMAAEIRVTEERRGASGEIERSNSTASTTTTTTVDRRSESQ